MHSDDIVVVGAGPAGLAVSACLRRKGLQHTVLEREDEIGATWRRHYDRLHLHTTKTCSGLPMTPWPKGTPRYPSRDAFLKYLQDYASTHHIAPRFGPTVGRTMPHRERSPTTKRTVAVAIASCSASGRYDRRRLMCWVGQPNMSRGITCAGPRTTMATSTLFSARSSAISAPELPHLTTKVRLPL